MKNETSEDQSKPVINNSSLLTAENSSSIQSKLNQRRIKLAQIKKKKYSNTALFENKNRKISSKDKNTNKNQKGGIYITDVTVSKFRDTNFETKSTLQTTHNIPTHNTTKTYTRRNFSKTNKNSLPFITNYEPKKNNDDKNNFLTYFGHIFNKDYVKNIYNEHLEDKGKELDENKKKKKNLNQKKNKTFRDDKNEYIRKTNEIKRLKYELDLKKKAMEDYQVNLQNQINSFDNATSNLLSYKEEIENNFIEKYNDGLRNLSRKIYDKKIESDILNNRLKELRNDINNLKQAIVKKENVIKDIEKWLKLQIYIKEGKEPLDIKKALIEYKDKLIFNSMDELEMTLNYKKYQNILLIEKYNKIEKEKEKLFPSLFEHQKSYNKLEQTYIGSLNEKIVELNSLKKQERNLKATLFQLKKNNLSFNEENDNTNINNKNNKKENNDNTNDSKIKVNELGIKYKPIKYKNNIYHYIDCIFCGMLANDITGISLSTKDSNQLSNVNIPKEKKALIQMNFIEICLNHLISNINNRILNDPNSKIILEKTCKRIDSYHKMVNVNRNKMEMKKKRDSILKKVEDRSNKNYVYSRGKYDFNIVQEEKNKKIERLKNKKQMKKIDIWDFFYDVQ